MLEGGLPPHNKSSLAKRAVQSTEREAADINTGTNCAGIEGYE